MSNAAYSVWLIWLTEDRLARWNGLRERAAIAPLSREDGARILAEADPIERRQMLDRIR